jgi:hypothetical protein
MGCDSVAESRHSGVRDAFKVVSADYLPGGQSKIKIFSGQVPRAKGPDEHFFWIYCADYFGSTSRHQAEISIALEILVLGYKKSNESPRLKVLLSRLDELVIRVSKKPH